jgi:threonine synthase
MRQEWLECLVCGERYSIAPMWTGCPKCEAGGKGAPLEVRYDYGSIDKLVPDENAPGIWRWHHLLPGIRSEPLVSLHEGGTPLCRLESEHRLITFWLKNESVNPTWSYKDRANCVNISVARELGFKWVAAISTGNHGSSAAAYAAAAGLGSVVFCHQETSLLQTSLMRLYGARVFQGGDRSGMLNRLVRRGGWFPSCAIDPFAGCSNPFGVEGFKSIAFEIFLQLGHKVPDRVFVPVGSGDGLYGIWKGFVELKKVGLARHLPRMIACQAKGAAPYANAFSKGLREVEAVTEARTIALSISEEQGGQPALWAVYDSEGEALACSEEEIAQAASEMAKAGYALEPASAAALACAKKVLSKPTEGQETWVLVGTGAYVKWAETLNHQFDPLRVLDPGFDRVEDLLGV